MQVKTGCWDTIRHLLKCNRYRLPWFCNTFLHTYVAIGGDYPPRWRITPPPTVYQVLCHLETKF